MTALSPHSAAQLQDLLKTKKAEEPKKAWRNKWETYARLKFIGWGGVTADPGIFDEDEDYPSKEVAERAAEQHISKLSSMASLSIKYLGAFPIE